MLVKFSLTFIFHHVREKFFKFMVFTFLENAWNPCIFTHSPVLHSNFQAEFLENLFSQDEKGGEDYDLQYQNVIRKHEDDLEH